MSLKVGIVGLANVGKSTLFNALLKRQQALAANYPFVTIEPNVGVVPVPDERLKKLAEVIGGTSSTPEVRRGRNTTSGESVKESILPPIVPATVEFVDIAALVKGASKGEGLGNKFLAHIREVDLICHLVRAFDDEDVVMTGTDPVSDYETVRIELELADLDAKEKINLLSKKPEIKVLNVGESRSSLCEIEDDHAEGVVRICAKMESDLAGFSDEERQEYLKQLGVEETGLDKLIRLAYEKLGLLSFLTAGVKEVRAWTVKRGAKAPEAAGVIHTDFEKNFIKAKVASFDDFVKFGGWKGVSEAGKLRIEGLWGGSSKI